jgi:hypothetical protein
MTLSLCLGESDCCQEFTSIFYNSRHHTSLSIGTLACLPVALSLGQADFPQSTLVTPACRSADPHGSCRLSYSLVCRFGCPSWRPIRQSVALLCLPWAFGSRNGPDRSGGPILNRPVYGLGHGHSSCLFYLRACGRAGCSPCATISLLSRVDLYSHQGLTVPSHGVTQA